MKSRAWFFAAALSASSLALAQTAITSSVTENTDPAKIAQIEEHARQLASQTPTTPMMGEHEHMQKHGKGKHGMRHHKSKAMHQRATKNKAPSDTPMAAESKN